MLSLGNETRALIRTHTDDHRRPASTNLNIASSQSRVSAAVRSTNRQPFRRASILRCEAIDTDVGPSTAAEARSAQLPEEEEPPSTSVPTFSTWELDFSSRPILDARGKKRWELLICSPDRSWLYSKWFPNNRINSTQVKCNTCCTCGPITVHTAHSYVHACRVAHLRPVCAFLQLKAALQEIIEAEGAVKPQTVRFFRGQMQTIISRALADLDIKPVPSRRCFSLIGPRMTLSMPQRLVSSSSNIRDEPLYLLLLRLPADLSGHAIKARLAGHRPGFFMGSPHSAKLYHIML